MTLPTVYPTGYDGTTADFRKTKVDRTGALRVITGQVAVANATATGTNIGLVPFNAGAKFSYGSRIYVTDIDTASAVTLNIGWIYSDNTTYTNNVDGFVAASTAGQAGGMIEMTSSEGVQFTAASDGWIVAQVATANPITGTISFNIGIAYDASGITNAGSG